jgi:formamidopyrimidine-DNA glycosylase
MPELPEVETLRQSLERHLRGDVISGVKVHSPRLREPIHRRTLERRLAGRAVEGLRRRAKYLLVDVEGGSTLVVHLGMSGRLTFAEPGRLLELHEHVVFDLASGRQLRFKDPRRFGLVFALSSDRLDQDRHFAHLGIEPLTPSFDGGYLASRASGRHAPVKSFLMDSGVVVGVGNIYASEALFRSGIHPTRRVDRIGASRWRGLARSVVEVLSEAIAQGGTTLNDFADADGEPGYFQVSLSVYGREGEPCRTCARSIRRKTLANRSTFYCPSCQR